MFELKIRSSNKDDLNLNVKKNILMTNITREVYVILKCV